MTEPLSALDDNPNDLPPNSSRPPRSEGAAYPKQQTGIADYFAILGVGEELVWRHAKKQQAAEPDPDSSANATTTNTTTTVEENDARLLERFYREIVDCAIWVADESSSTQHSSAQQYPATVVYTDTAKNNNRPSYPAAALPTSPSPSDVTSSITIIGATEGETVELEGWTVIQQTRPLSAPPASSPGTNEIPPLWARGQVWDANLDPLHGLTGRVAELAVEQQRRLEGRKKSSTPLKDLRQKVQSTFQQRLVSPYSSSQSKKKFYLSFRQRSPDESTRPAIADLELFFVRLHKATLPPDPNEVQSVRDDDRSEKTNNSSSLAGGSTVSQKGAAALLRVAEAGKQTFQSRVFRNSHQPAITSIASQSSTDFGEPVALESLLELPSGLQEWSIPELYRELRFPSHPPTSETPYKTILFPPAMELDMDGSSAGIEAVEREPPSRLISPTSWRDRLQPKMFPAGSRVELVEDEDDEYVFVPIAAIRRQRIGEEERFHEDPAIVEMAVSFVDNIGKPVLPYEEIDPFEEEDDDAGMTLLEKSAWTTANTPPEPFSPMHHHHRSDPKVLGTTCLIVRRNAPLGFCDAAFSTTVLDRFPYKNYKGLPLPEEELPMFCYPTGCRLHRAQFCDAPLPQYYGFVVKNERGDSIYVSCVSFMEPLTQQKRRQLDRLSENRRRVSLPHARFCAKQERRRRRRQGTLSSRDNTLGDFLVDSDESDDEDDDESNMLLTGFDEGTTFENKTICLVSRYPYWSAFRRFLSHLHSVSGSTSDLPLERYISHLLLAVPIPKPGGPSVLIPLPTFNVPMMLWSPPSKDLPLLDLPYERLVSCLDIPTIVTVVLGFLALERKVSLLRFGAIPIVIHCFCPY
jgi:hypothetical protein